MADGEREARGPVRDLASFDAPVEPAPPRGVGERVDAALRGVAAALGLKPPGSAAAARLRAQALDAFAATALRLRASGRPTVLLISHDWGGGVERQMRGQVAAQSATTDFLLVTPRGSGAELSVPGQDGHARLRFGPDDIAMVLGVLRPFPLARLHVHHVIGFRFNVKPIVEGLGLPFDFSVHDYFPLCPRINMVTPWDMRFCGEAPEAACNRCLASGAEPAGGRGDIATHRARYGWLFTGAGQVICPSEDVRLRLARYGVTDRVVTRPHEPPRAAVLRPARRLAPGEPLRVVLLGSLMPHKGLWLVRDTVLAARGKPISFSLIGATEPKLALPPDAAFAETGAYREADLASLIAASGADVMWFPSVAPETYGFTLSAAIDAGLPIVASDRGAFRERLAGADWSWLAPAEATPAEMLALFATVRAVVSLPTSQW